MKRVTCDPKAMREAARRYEALHEGYGPAVVQCVPRPPRQRYIVEMGRTPLEQYNKEVREENVVHAPPYKHDHESFAAQPFLAHDDRGRLLYTHGDYTVTPHGIEDLPMHRSNPTGIPYARSSEALRYPSGNPWAPARSNPSGVRQNAYASSYGPAPYGQPPQQQEQESDWGADAMKIVASAGGLTLGGALILQQTTWAPAAKSALTGGLGLGAGLLIGGNSPAVSFGLIAGGAVNLLQALFLDRRSGTTPPPTQQASISIQQPASAQLASASPSPALPGSVQNASAGVRR